MYQKIIVATSQPVGQPGPLPSELVGLADETLANLSALRDQVPQYDGVGFIPVPVSPSYAELRTNSPFPEGYGTIVQQMELIGEKGIDAFQQHIAAVKARFPKPL